MLSRKQRQRQPWRTDRHLNQIARRLRRRISNARRRRIWRGAIHMQAWASFLPDMEPALRALSAVASAKAEP